MRLSGFLLCLAVCAGVPAGAQQSSEPSLTYKYVRLVGGFGGNIHQSGTSYMRGVNMRQETRWHRATHGFGSVHASIWNRDLHYRFELDLAAKAYTVTQVDERGLPFDRPHIDAKWKPSGRTYRVHIETIDTGERRTMFGYTARRVIIRKTTVTNPPGDSSEWTTETDSWYIDRPLALRQAPAVTSTSYGGASMPIYEEDDVRVTSEGPKENGWPLARRTRARYGTRPFGAYLYERIIEISERPVDPALFLPPPDFKRVSQLPAAQTDYQYPFSLRVRLNWLMLTDYGL